MQLLQYYLLWSYLLNLEGKYWNQLRLSLVRIERSKDSAAFDLLAERRQEYFDDFAITSEDITTFFYHIMHDFMIRFFFFFFVTSVKRIQNKFTKGFRNIFLCQWVSREI